MHKKKILHRLCFISIGASVLLAFSAFDNFSSSLERNNLSGVGQIIAAAILAIGGLHGLISVEKSNFRE